MGWLSNWAYRRKITIDNTNIDSDLTHFPVPVPLGTSVGMSDQDVTDIFTEVGDDYSKIAVTMADGETQLYVEVEQWDATNNKGLLWVSRDTWSVLSGSDTEIYLYFDSEALDNTTYVGIPGNQTEVWNSIFESVYTYAQDPSGGTGSIKDSTSNANHLSPQTSMASGDLIDGLIGKGIRLDGSDDWLKGGGTTENFDSPYSVLCLFNLKTAIDSNQSNKVLFGKEDSSKGFSLLWTNDGGKLRWLTNNGNIQTAKNSWTADTWYCLQAVQRTNSDAEIWVDLTSEAFGNNGYSGYQNIAVEQGHREANPGGYLHIVYCHLRYVKDELSDAWRKADHHALTDNLLTWGATEQAATYKVAGVVKQDGNPVERTVRAYKRASGELLGETTSLTDGRFEIELFSQDEVYAVALDDTSDADDFNALIFDRIVPVSVD